MKDKLRRLQHATLAGAEMIPFRRVILIVAAVLLCASVLLFCFFRQAGTEELPLMCNQCGRVLEEPVHQIKVNNWIMVLCDDCYERIQK